MIREGFKRDEPLEIAVNQKSHAESDQDRAEKKSEPNTEQKSHGVFAFRCRNSRRKRSNRFWLAEKRRSEDLDVGCQPKFDFVARLPEQIQSRANHERSDDTEKLRHSYRPRPAVRE